MLPLIDLVDHVLPPGTRHVAGPSVAHVFVTGVAVLDGRDVPSIDRQTVAVMVDDGSCDLVSGTPAALIMGTENARVESVDYPILLVPPGHDLHHVAEAIATRLHDEHATLAMRGIDVYRQLSELAIAGAGVDGIAAAGARLLGLAITVADDEWRPICAFDPQGSATDQPCEHDLRWLRERACASLLGEHMSPSAPPVIHVPSSEAEACALAPIVLPTGPAGYIWVTAPLSSLTPLVDVGVGNAAAVCAIEMSRERAVLEAQLRLRGNFVEELLTDGYQSIGALRQRARFLGYDLDRPHAVAVFDIDHFARYIAAQPVSGEGMIVKLKERYTRLVANAIGGGTAALVWPYSDAVVTLLPTVPGARNEVVERADDIRAAVQSRLGGPTVSVGVGRVYDRPELLHRSYSEARDAVRIGLATAGPGATTPFDRLGVYRLLFRLRDEPEFEEFRDELLGPLERYDRVRGTDLLHTLERYLACNANVARATEELHLHRNGLLYRLQRITELTGADFADAHQRLSYHLALLARAIDEE